LGWGRQAATWREG